MAIIQRPAHSTSRTRRRTRRGDGVRFPIVVSIVVLIVVALVARRRPIAYRPQGFHPGEAVILGAYIPRRFPQLILSALGSSSHPSHGSPFHQDERTSKQQEDGKAEGQAGGRLSLSVPSLYSRPPYRPHPRLASRIGGRGEGRLAPVDRLGWRSRFPIPVARQGMALGSVPPSRQASRQGRPAPVPLLVSARGSPSPGGQSTGRESKTPRSPYRGTGRKAFRRSIGRGYCSRRHPSYRRRYTWSVPAPGDSSRRR